MVSDEELVERLREFLRVSDLATTTPASVRRKLEEDFGVDLSEKKAFISAQIDIFLSELDDKKEGEEEEEPEEEEENGARVEEGEGGSGEDDEREEEGEDEEEEEEGKSNGAGSRKRRHNKMNKEVKKRGGGGGFTKVCSLSPQLQEFVGEAELARTEVVRKLWAYIRENNLQDPNNKRRILCDGRLQNLFNVSSIDMFQMNKALTKHIWPLPSEDGTVTSTPAKSGPRDKQPKREKEGKRQKGGGGSGLLVPLPLSDELVKFIGTGENTLSRSAVVKRMWEYIKQNNLQDPADKRNIICDEKLKELFKVDTFLGFSVTKLLASHFIKSK